MIVEQVYSNLLQTCSKIELLRSQMPLKQKQRQCKTVVIFLLKIKYLQFKSIK